MRMNTIAYVHDCMVHFDHELEVINIVCFFFTEASRSELSPEGPGFEIRELEGSPTSLKRRSPSSVSSDSEGRSSPSSPLDATWPRMASSPRRKKEKDVFKFLKETDPNYTIRRQQLQMNLILEKNQHVKKVRLDFQLKPTN